MRGVVAVDIHQEIHVMLNANFVGWNPDSC